MKKALLVAAAVATSAAAALLATYAIDRQPPTGEKAEPLSVAYLGQQGVRMQSGQRDCGLAALQMVLEDYGIESDLHAERAAAVATGEPFDLLELRILADERGLTGTGWSGGLEQLASAPMPLIAYTDFHFVVVDSVTEAGVFVRDPAIGRLRYLPVTFQERWAGVAMSFQPK